MPAAASAFLCGVLLFQFLPELPSPVWLLALLPTVMVLIGLRGRGRTAGALVAGGLWALLHAHWVLGQGLDPALEGADLVVEGRVASLPEPRERAVRFRFDIDAARHADEPVASPSHVRLSWYGQAPPLSVGERWRLVVRLKRPSGYRNPGGFDYEAWLFRQGIRATGYVRDGEANRRLAGAGVAAPIGRFRQQLSARIGEALEGDPMRGLVEALAIGERSRIDPAQWDVLNRTGTSHLVAISGLHIGLVAGLLFFLARWSWSRSARLSLRLPAQRAAALVAMAGALVYAAMAGFSLPTQRALIMVAVVMAALFWQRRVRPAQGLSLALLAVLLLDPLAVLAPGFWLSFGAVAIILYAMSGRLGRGAWFQQWGRVQWVVAVGLFPVLVWFFQEASLVAPLANLLAVPIVSFAIVPVVLLGAVLLSLLPALGSALLALAAELIGFLWAALAAFAGTPFATWTGVSAVPALLAACLGALVMLAPRGLPARWLGAVLCLPLLTADAPRPEHGTAWFTLLDVGQGLAAVVRTRGHTLVYDTGPRYGEHFDTGAAVVVPFLRERGVDRLDRVVVSHGDNDHRGGAASLLKAYPAPDVVSADPARLDIGSVRPCRAGERWRWDGVEFAFLHPPADPNWAPGNDRSCVLRVRARGQVLLLTGDIERAAEWRLLRAPEELPADILVAPHHGSKTSSGADFIAAVDPRYVLFPVGYRNRWEFPRASVVARYEAQGAVLLDTARDGAIGFRLGGAGGLNPPRRHRHDHRRYWHRE